MDSCTHTHTHKRDVLHTAAMTFNDVDHCKLEKLSFCVYVLCSRFEEDFKEM